MVHELDGWRFSRFGEKKRLLDLDLLEHQRSGAKQLSSGRQRHLRITRAGKHHLCLDAMVVEVRQRPPLHAVAPEGIQYVLPGPEKRVCVSAQPPLPLSSALVPVLFPLP